jgi:hypothetical protein
MALPGQQTPAGVPAFKLVLVGDGGTGARRAMALITQRGLRPRPACCLQAADAAQWLMG